MSNTKKIMVLFMVVATSIFAMSGTVSAVACSDAGDFSTLCTLFTNLSNLVLAVISVIFTGANATTIIYAVVVLAVIVGFIDLMRGNESWIGRKLRRV